jgi:hypothetical protein
MKKTKNENIQPIVITNPTYKVQDLWISIFGDVAVAHYPDESRVRKAWREFGEILGNTKAMKIQYETAGLKESSKKLDSEIDKRTKELESRTLEIIGYPKLPDFSVSSLKSEANKIGKFLNQYSLEAYPHLPPQICVEAMQKAKPFFDSFEVWAVEDIELKEDQESKAVKAERAFKDPVIIGCKETRNQYNSKIIERYFVASWGDDIPLEYILGGQKQIN